MSQNKKTDLCVILKKFVILYRKTRILKMKDIDQKIAAFEYAMYQLINWYKESVSTELRNIETHFTRLTSLKLLFLLASVKNLARQNQDLLNQFDNFCAMQYGPVESDIYTAIVLHKTKVYQFGNRQISILDSSPQFENLDSTLKGEVDGAITQLKKINNDLISYHASHLVEITHKWDSWRNAMAIANWMGKGSEHMSIESIRNSTPFYV